MLLMEIPTDWFIYAKWSGILTLVCLVVAVLAFVLQWGLRFRLVGVTAFMAVLTVALFTLGLSVFNRPAIPGALRYALVYDNAASQAVIALPPQPLSASSLEATLRQAAYDLYSPGRLGTNEAQLTIRLRTILHPEPRVSVPLYLGNIKRALGSFEDDNMEVEINQDNLAKLPS